MIDRTKPPRFPQLKSVGRDPYRLSLIHEVRLENDDLRVIDAEWKRVKLYHMVCGKLNPQYGAWLKNELYNNPRLFETLDLPSPDTILKDNREMERLGFWQKPVKEPLVQQATQ